MTVTAHSPPMEEDPAHQFQMMLKPLRKAVQLGNLEAAVRFASNLLEIGGDVAKHEGRKVHFLLAALEGAPVAFKSDFADKVLGAYGGRLSDDARLRLSSILDRL